MKKIFTLLFLFAIAIASKGQQLFYEPFDYASHPTNGLHLQSGGLWERTNNGDSILVADGSLSYAGLQSSTGNKAKYSGTGSDNFRTFATQTSGTVFTSFILNVPSMAAVTTGSGYAIALVQAGSTSNFAASVWFRASANGYNIGIATRTTAASVAWLPQELSFNTSYFIVTAYEMVSGTANDVAKIWLNTTSIGGTMPAADATAAPGTDLASIGKMVLRQDSDANTPAVEIDEIRVGTTWESVTPAASTSVQTPTITSIAPTSATAGGAGFTLTVTGTNFVNGASTVTWNGADRPTTFVSATELTATISAADIAAAGTANVAVTTTGAASPSNTVIFTINAAATPSLSATTLTGFGNTCVGTIANTQSFNIFGSNLTAAPVEVSALEGYTFSTTLNGTYTSTLSITQPGGSFSQEVFVKFAPLAVQSYDGNITIGGGGATPATVAAFGTGVNTAPSVTTGIASGITTSGATLPGTITATGCSSIGTYGIEWSTTSGFANGTGTAVAATNLTGGGFSVDLSSLAPATTYYFKAYAANSGGTTYGTQQSFTTASLTAPAAPVATAATGVTHNSFTANWNAVAGATNYFIDVYTMGTGANSDTIAGWNFSTNTAASLTADEGNGANLGIQQLTHVGAGAAITHPGGPTSTTGTNPYSASTTNWDNGMDAKYWTITVNTAGASNITLSSLQGSSNSGPKDFKIQYKVGATGAWTDVPNGTVTMPGVGVSPNNLTTWAGVSNLPLPADASNQPEVSIRWIMTSNNANNAAAIATTGTSRISAIYVSGSTGTTTVPVYVSGYQNLAVVDVTSVQVTGLAPQTTYYYVVRAQNGGGTSVNSNEIAVATTAAPAPAFTAGTLTDFGSVVVGNTSTAQTFTLSGVNLTGAPGTITVSAPADYEVSADNTSWGNSATINYTGATLAATTVYVRFAPQAAGTRSGNISINGGGASATVAVTGTGTVPAPPAAPVATAATAVTYNSFTANWNAVAGATNYYLDVYTLGTGTAISTLAGWNFTTNTAAAQTADAGNANNLGIQQINGVGLNTISWPTGPSGTGGTPNPWSVSANGWDNGAGTKYWIATVNTTGASNITVSSLQGSSGTGPKDFKLQYMIGTTNNWIDIPNGTVTMPAPVGPGNLATWGTVTDLPLPADASNQPLVSIRWINTSTTSVNNGTVASGGTSRISGVYIKGSTGTATVPLYVPGYQGLAVGNVTSHTVTGLNPTTTYYYVVRAENAGGISPNSNEITVVTAADTNPAITATSLTAFGEVCTGAAGGPNSFTLNGTNLTAADITVGPLAGYTFSTTANGTYTATLTLTQPGGAFTQPVFVRFEPTAVQSYNGAIPVSGGGLATTVLVNASGSGVFTPATVTTGAATAITNVSARTPGTINSFGCAPIMSYGIEWSTTSGFTSGTQVPGASLTGISYIVDLAGLTPNTTYYYKAFAITAAGTAYGTEMSFTTLAAPPVTLTATALAAFGDVCVGIASAPASFNITGGNLTAADLVVGPLAGYSFSTTANGTYTATLTLPHAAGNYTQEVFVRFTPTAAGVRSGNIPVSGGGATAIAVAATGTGVATPPVVVTGDVDSLTTYSASLEGAVTAAGCSPVTGYGIEWSTINGFANGTGTRVAANNLSGNAFSVNLTGLVQGATYYYKAYAQNAGGIAYGVQQSFTVNAIADVFTVYPVPAARGSELRFSSKNLAPGYYGIYLYNSAGQQVFRGDFNVQGNFINDRIVLPASLPFGVYRLRMVSNTAVIGTKSIIVY